MKRNFKLTRLLLRSFPNFLWFLKKYILKESLKSHGSSVSIGPNVSILEPNLVSLGSNVFIGDNTVISNVVEVFIGNNVLFGPGVMLIAGDHNLSEIGKPMYLAKEGGENRTIVIENDVWIGSRVIVLKGVILSEGAVIGAGSVVTKSMPPYSICMGNPCKPKKLRFTKGQLVEHLTIVESNYKAEESIFFKIQ